MSALLRMLLIPFICALLAACSSDSTSNVRIDTQDVGDDASADLASDFWEDPINESDADAGDADEGFDKDGDGFTLCDGDCNDLDPDVFPGSPGCPGE